MLVFSVQDNGQGIPAESLPHIFDRFYRADPARAQGTNLGWGWRLPGPLSRRTAGAFPPRAEVGKGTRVKIVFPLA